jgi:hypothetical protein
MARPKGSPKLGGRSKGTPNRATAKREAEIAAAGITPLEFMLRRLRDETASAEDRFEAAKAAAPYVHPKLAAVDLSSKDGTMTPRHNADAVMAALARKHDGG